MSAGKPEWAAGEYGVDYGQIVNSWGYEVLDLSMTGSYQGDYEALLRDKDGRYGIVVFGYGSCSGCDALQAVEPWGDDGDWTAVIELRDSLARDVRWFDTATDAATWIDTALDSDGSNWWMYDDEVREVLTYYRDRLAAGAA